MDALKHDPNRKPVDSNVVYRSPEFRALCEKFGIAWGLRTHTLVLRLPRDGVMTVEQEYQATTSRDTTNQHNETWRTYAPGSDAPDEVLLVPAPAGPAPGSEPTVR